MKITLVISSLDPGGAERVMSNLANYLVNNRHEITLMTFASPNIKPFYILDPRISLIQLNQSSNLPEIFIIRFLNIFKRIFYLRKAFKKLSPDVILSFVDVMNITAVLASLGLKIPIIISERIDPAHNHLNIFYNWLRLHTYPYAQQLIVQTKFITSYFPKKFESFTKVIPNPVIKPKKFKNFEIKTINKIVSIGRLELQKDYQILITAFSRLIRVQPNLQLTIYGEGMERANLELLIHSFNLGNKVKLPGITKNIEEVLLEADLFILPSRYEGFPNALCEAMAIGLPVIASNCSSHLEIIRDGIDGKLFVIGDVEDLINKILNIIENPNYGNFLSKNAINIVERFNAQRIFSQWDQILFDTINNKV